MASFFISEVGLKPFPRIYVRPKAGLVSRNTSNPKFLRTSNTFYDLKPTYLIEFSTVLFGDNKWGLKVSTPLKVASIEQYEEKDERINGINTFEEQYEEKDERINGINMFEEQYEEKDERINGINTFDEQYEEKDERINGINTFDEQEDEARFDPGAPPAFKLADIRAAIPQHCWVKDTWKSMSYVVRDFAFIFIFAAASSYLNNWLVWPLYWAAQGTMFWGLFVLGHDCGHGSFSSNPKLNSIVGHLLHTPVLVPYNGWRISHRLHHQNQGHVENDESWHPISETVYRNLNSITQTWRYKLPFPMFVYPFYLWKRSPGKTGSHFHPNSDLFVPNDRNDLITSTLCCMAKVAFLVGLGFKMGPMMLLKLYGVPYWIFIVWLDFVTYMHHHGHQDRLPWYRGKEWSYFRGGLTTVDHDYGWFNNIHHDIGTHAIHHLFPQIPHYHLVEATEAAKPVLGKYYRDPEQSGPLPFHLIEGFIRSMKKDHYVSDTGDVVYYQTDPDLYKSA